MNGQKETHPLKNYGAQIKYAKERQDALVRDWAASHRDLIQIADREGFKYVLRREVEKVASLAAQREYRHNHDQRIPLMDVELPEGRFDLIRKAFGGDKPALKDVAEAISHGAS